MDKKYEDELFKKYPTIFPNGRNVDSIKSFLCFGIETGNGWKKLIDDMCSKLSNKCVAVQVKEKFGGLRFYCEGGTKEDYMKIQEAEEESFKICEICGKPGKLYTDGWYKVKCRKCYNK